MSDTQPEPPPEIARAEEVVDAAGRAIASLAQHVWLRLARDVALAREEAEDIVAEARSMSRDYQE